MEPIILEEFISPE